MCPKDKIISAYLDGELKPGAVDKVRSHMDSCSSCAGKYQKYAALSGFMRQDAAVSMDSAAPSLSSFYSKMSHSKAQKSGWSRQISLPRGAVFSAAAAFVVMLFFTFYLSFYGIPSFQSKPDTPVGFQLSTAESEPAVSKEPEDLDALIKLMEDLDSDSFKSEISFILPEDMNVQDFSSPLLVKTSMAGRN